MNTNLFLVLDLVAKSSSILLLGFAVQRVWRHSSAAQLCLLWCAVFTVLSLLPLGALMQPRWTVNVPAVTRTVVTPPTMTEVTSESSVSVAPASQLSPTPHRVLAELSAAQWLGVAWLTGVIALLGYRMMGWVQLRRLSQRSHPLQSAAIQKLASRIQAELRVGRRVEVRMAGCVSVPLTWGILRPVVVLPEAASDWSEAYLEAALRHELAHIRHYDALTRLLMNLVCALHWPNVLVWFAAKSWQTAQEQACDDLVLKAGSCPQAYAQQLLDAARAVQAFGLTGAPVLAMARASTLATRLKAIMDSKRERRTPGGVMFGAAGLLAVLVLGLGTSLQLRGIEAKTPRVVEQTQIEILTRVVEAKTEAKALRDSLLNQFGDKPKELTAPEAAVLWKRLEQAKGVDVLAAPTVATRSGQMATIQVGSEKVTDGAAAKTEFIGTKIDLTPTLDKGRINLMAKPQLRELDANSKVAEWTAEATVPMESGNTIALIGKSKETGAQHRVILFLVTAKIASPLPPATSKATADKIVFPKVALQEAGLEEVAEFIRLMSPQHDPAKQGVSIILRPEAESSKAKITLSLTNIKLTDMLSYVEALSGIKVHYETSTIVFVDTPLTTKTFSLDPSAAAKIGDAKSWLVKQGVNFPSGAVVTMSQRKDALTIKASSDDLSKIATLIAGISPAESGAAKLAKAIILPSVQFREATVKEAVDHLRSLVPVAEGLEIILQPDDASKTALLTLDLKNIPLLEALKYVAELSGLRLKVGETTITLEPKPAQ